MEFLDEFESKPRFLFQSKQQHFTQSETPDDSPCSSSFRFICVSIFAVFFILSFIYINVEPLRSLLLWICFSLVIGPFAPSSLTAGDIRVGLGPPLTQIPTNASLDIINDKFNRKSTKTLKKTPEDAPAAVHFEKSTIKDGSLVDKSKSKSQSKSKSESESESDATEKTKSSEWNEFDDELLRKLMGKHPVGMPGRWEAIAEGFKGNHKIETVITKAKEMKGVSNSDRDSYNKFLKDRKSVDKRVIDEGLNANENVEQEKKESGWSASEDLALLNALKTFPKDVVSMRWEKIAASVPGKTKSACMARVKDLKKDFRSSKA
ncbi:hypothetical protein ABFS82_01G111300 [Erythranthe guttata]|uniref:Myb-like domain-containing protein n=1 Tax=Erythranthe guttata TaxID=4155 RepID=A0A022R2F9_ERYGU|nr:PREDICTED: dnaJ homolog subfamily C member 1 [Erythranthe guttata]EYU34139.1 hypothetical protein MIMGU_mgv1a010189mg [Erythranthe guttata]|eukprot:XP_012841307.1 PREDICTED: dnaJ homolog subfamily C member 1 [Erythranthe guttata]